MGRLLTEMTTEAPQNEPRERSQLHLEREEGKLWRMSLLFLSLLATGLAAASWENFKSLPQRLHAVPIGTVVLAVLFAVYVASKLREIAELRGVVRGLQQRGAGPPTEEQLGQLVQVIAESQRGYRELIDSFQDVVFAVSLQGAIQTMNRAFADILQRSFSELSGHSLEEFLDEPTRPEMAKGLPRFLDHRHWSGVVRVRLKNTPQVRYFDCILHPLLKDHEVAGIAVLARDITQQKEREARFTEFFETLQEGVYFSTPEGKLLDANPALLRMLGYDSKEELLAVSVEELYVDPSQRRQELRDLEQNGSVREREVRLRRKDGKPILCLDTSRAVSDSSGRLVRYQGTLVDITRRREIEARLQQEEEFRRRLVDCFPDLILVLDKEGRYTFVSPRIRELLGYEPDALLGRHAWSPDSPAGTQPYQLYRDLISGERLFGSAEYTDQHHDGSRRILRATASPLFDAAGKLAGVVASVRDVTTEKQLEQQLVQAERLAGMGQMIDGFAHELNNPLTAVLGAIELLEVEALGKPAVKNLELLKRQARRAAEIVQNLLFFSRPQADGQCQLDLNELAQRSLQLHEHSLRANNIAVDFLPEESLPPVVANPNQLMQVFLNLIINAEHAIGEARGRGTLRVRLGRTQDTVWASFQDDGPGISPEILPKIFDPFFTTRRPGRGTGLGLSICLAIVKKYGGNIEAQPAPGGGSVFTVSLPITSDRRVTASEAD